MSSEISVELLLLLLLLPIDSIIDASFSTAMTSPIAALQPWGACKSKALPYPLTNPIT